MKFRTHFLQDLVGLAKERRQPQTIASEAVTFRSMRKFVLLGVLFIGLAVIGQIASKRSQTAQGVRNGDAASAVGVLGAGRGAEGGAQRAPAPSGRDSRLVFGPAVDLERSELAMLERAKQSVDVAMYSFTDMELARELIGLEAHGVRVRVYRDAAEYRKEEATGKVTTSALLRSGGVEVRVKAGDELMHMKSYAVDGDFLRTGSANWSVSALRYQDNDILYFRSPVAVSGFEAEFGELWDRPDNLQVKAAN